MGYSHWTKTKVPPPDLEYNQAHKPVREQEVAIGHSVRAVYMYTAMADLARETGDQSLLDACRRLWNNIVNKQMYITGGIGSTHHGEAFSFDYDLPNDTIYAETCASIGLIFFAHRMLQIEPHGRYADVMERALYNTVLSSMSRDGRHFFYVNPLEVWPEASVKNPGKRHVKPVRQKWFGCACCPPNVARLLTSLNQYIYSYDKNTVYAHLYIGGEAEIQLESGIIKLKQENRYPWEGKIKFTVTSCSAGEVVLALRIPNWCKNWSVAVNCRAAANIGVENGYALVSGCWKAGDEIVLDMELSVELMQANPKVRADAGKVAVQRGPLVYCFEQTDNGENLSALALDLKSDISSHEDSSVLEGAIFLKANGFRTDAGAGGDELYIPYRSDEKEVELKAVPYFMWGNRAPGEMLVWIAKK